MKIIEKFYSFMLPIVGALCVIVPGYIVKWLPVVLGGIMILTSITEMFFNITEKKYMDSYAKKASSLILLVMGICFILGGEKTIFIMGITWGLLGLQEVNEELEKILRNRANGDDWKLMASFALIKLVLSLALIFEPAEKFNAHIILLGLEIIAVSVKGESIVAYLKDMRINFNSKGR